METPHENLDPDDTLDDGRHDGVGLRLHRTRLGGRSLSHQGRSGGDSGRPASHFIDGLRVKHTVAGFE